MRNILFVSQEIENKKICGIGVIGNLIGNTIAKSTKYNIHNLFCDSPEKLLSYCNDFNPDIIFYNYAHNTMDWVRDNCWKENLNCKHVLVYHDGNQNLANNFSSHHWYGFEYMVTDDPTLETHNSKIFFTTRRLIPPYKPEVEYKNYDYPIIGFQGQLAGHKGLNHLFAQVQKEFKKAIIRLHCPAYEYGNGQHHWDETFNFAKSQITNTNIEIQLTTDILTDQEIVNFLAENTINCYFYDYLDQCGLASSTDYALAARRPICVTRSYQFRHFWGTNPSILIENTTIQNVINNGLKPLEKYYNDYTEENVIDDYNRIIDEILSN